MTKETELLYCKTINYCNNLFGKIGEFKKIAKISHRQITISQFLDIPVLVIAKLIICQIVISEKLPNIIAAKYSRFTVHGIQIWSLQKYIPVATNFTDYLKHLTKKLSTK